MTASPLEARLIAERPHAELSRAEINVFRAFLTAHARVTKILEAELLAAHQLSLAEFDVFAQLSEQPGHAMRMTDLAEAVLLSRSGVTRLVDRLEKDDLVRRDRIDSDRRNVAARLTEAGMRMFLAAAKTHRDGIRSHFVSRFDIVELAAIGRLCGELAEAAGPTANATDDTGDRS